MSKYYWYSPSQALTYLVLYADDNGKEYKVTEVSSSDKSWAKDATLLYKGDLHYKNDIIHKPIMKGGSKHFLINSGRRDLIRVNIMGKRVNISR
jgi:hypothetical protein